MCMDGMMQLDVSAICLDGILNMLILDSMHMECGGGLGCERTNKSVTTDTPMHWGLYCIAKGFGEAQRSDLTSVTPPAGLPHLANPPCA